MEGKAVQATKLTPCATLEYHESSTDQYSKVTLLQGFKMEIWNREIQLEMKV